MDNLRILSTLYNLDYRILLLVCVFLALLFVALMYYLSKMIEEKRKQRDNEIFLRNSTKYRNIKQINCETHFHKLSPAYDYYISCKSIKQYDCFNSYEWLIEQTINEDNEMELLLRQVEENRKNYEKYLEKIEGVLPTPQEIVEESGMKVSRFYRMEHNRCTGIELCPVVELIIVAHVSYISPKGRNRYGFEIKYDENEIKEAFSIAEQRRRALEYKKSFDYQKRFQRTLMTPSLRYDIMKRDGFRCCICGASSYSGAELEVDHIIPISRGGMTKKENLRTLCKTCNRGKGAKYEPDGLN